MSWVAVDKNGDEMIYMDKPIRYAKTFGDGEAQYVPLSEGTILKLIGRELTWDDEPVELK